MMADLDARGLLCPLPVLRLRKHLLSMNPGQRIRLIATDRAALIDVPHFCAETGHMLIETETLDNAEYAFVVECGQGPLG